MGKQGLPAAPAPRRIIVSALALLPLLVIAPLLGRADAVGRAVARLRVISSDASGMLLELTVPLYSSRLVGSESARYVELEAPGLVSLVGGVGTAPLPGLVRVIGLPPSAEVRVTVLTADVVSRTLPYPLLPSRAEDDPRSLAAGEHVPPTPRVHAVDGFYPPDLVSVESVGFARDQHIARIVFHPLRVNPVGNLVEHARRMVVRIDFVGEPVSSATRQLSGAATAGDHLDQALLNGEQAASWRGFAEDFRAPEPGLLPGVPVYKITVDQDGIYRVTTADLLAAGLDVTGTNPLSFSLSSREGQVAIDLIGDGDQLLEPAEGFLFYGRRFYGTVMEEKYTRTNVYWLNVQGPPGPRIPPVDGSPAGATPVTHVRATARREQDLLWNPVRTVVLGDMDTWYWVKAVAPVAGQAVVSTRTVQLTAPASGEYTATIRVALFAECKYYCDGEKHHARVYFNGVQVDEQGQDGSWVNIEPRLLTGVISQTSLVDGANELAWVLRTDVVGPSPWGVYLNWFEVEYERLLAAEQGELTFATGQQGSGTYTVTGLMSDVVHVWDITDPANPVRIDGAAVLGGDPPAVAFQTNRPAGARFVVAGEDRVREPRSVARYLPPDLDAPRGADWIAISHPAFITEARRLADHRAEQGLRTLVINVDDVYNQYGGGLLQPYAIRDYLAHALLWPAGAPTFVLLVGDGNWNFFGIPGYATEPNYIPPFLGFVDPYQGEVPADNLYATLVGDDALPDLALGRLPARSAAEAALLIDKILAHESQLTAPQPWQYNVAFLSDDAEVGSDFPGQSDAAAALLPAYLNPVKVYYGREPYTTVVAARQGFLDAFSGGATILNYRGHGSLTDWADEDLLAVGSVGLLNNLARLPVVLTMDCLDTYFAYPGNQSLAEVLLRHSSGGSVGHWGSSGLGVPADHSILSNAFFHRLFDDRLARFGSAVLAAKADFYASGSQLHNLHTFTLLGDPAMPLMVTDLRLEKTIDSSDPYQPGDHVTFGLYVDNQGLLWAPQSTITDLLPAEIVSVTIHSAGVEITPMGGESYVWSTGPVVPGSHGVITLSGRIDPGLMAQAGVWLTNTAWIDNSGMDWVQDNNADRVRARVTQPVLRVTKTAADRALASGLLTYTLWITNVGTADAAELWLEDTLPSHTSLHAASGIPEIGDRTVTWSLPVLGVGDGTSRKLVVRIDRLFSGDLVNQGYRAWGTRVPLAAGAPVHTQVERNGSFVFLPWIAGGGS